AGLAAAVVLFLWVEVTVPQAETLAIANYRQSIRVRDLVSGLTEVRAKNRNKTLLLSGVDEELFNASIGQQMLRVVGLYNVYLAPGGSAPPNFALSERETQRGLRR